KRKTEDGSRKAGLAVSPGAVGRFPVTRRGGSPGFICLVSADLPVPSGNDAGCARLFQFKRRRLELGVGRRSRREFVERSCDVSDATPGRSFDLIRLGFSRSRTSQGTVDLRRIGRGG